MSKRDEPNPVMQALVADVLGKLERDRQQAKALAQQAMTDELAWVHGSEERLRAAQVWLCSHFNADQESAGLLDPPTFVVKFQGLGHGAVVAVRLYNVLGPAVEYVWVDSKPRPYWHCISSWCVWWGTRLYPFDKMRTE